MPRRLVGAWMRILFALFVLVGRHADGASLMPRIVEWVERLAGVVAAEKAAD